MIVEPIREYNFTNLIFLSLLKKTKYEVVKSYLRVSVIKAQAPSLPPFLHYPPLWPPEQAQAYRWGQ